MIKHWNRAWLAVALPAALLAGCGSVYSGASPRDVALGNSAEPFKVGVTVFDPALPPEPKLPDASHVCATLVASFPVLPNGLLPDSVDDPALGAASTAPDSARIQEALNHCGAGNAVKLVAGSGTGGFVAGSLALPSGVTLWIDKGATLFAARDPRQYDVVPGTPSCGNTAKGTPACKALIVALATSNSGVVGDGKIDGRGGSQLVVAATDNAGRELKRSDGSNLSWWDISWRANKVGDVGTTQANPHLISVSYGHNFTLYRITLQNSPKFHVVPNGVDGFMAWGVKVHTPTETYRQMKNYLGMHYDVDTAKNTDAFDPGGAAPQTINGVAYSGVSNNTVLAYSYISTGDDDFVPKGSFGPITNIIVAHNHFYSGHGLSIGSETNAGVSNMRAYDLSFNGDGTSENQALRIKSDASKGGLVTGISYQNICIRNMTSPLVFDSYYSKNPGTRIPSFQNILLKDIQIQGGGKVVVRGWDAAHPVKIALDNVTGSGVFSFPHASSGLPAMLSNAEISMGPGPVSIPFQTSAENHVAVKTIAGNNTANTVDCSQAFVPFPQ